MVRIYFCPNGHKRQVNVGLNKDNIVFGLYLPRKGGGVTGLGKHLRYLRVDCCKCKTPMRLWSKEKESKKQDKKL